MSTREPCRRATSIESVLGNVTSHTSDCVTLAEDPTTTPNGDDDCRCGPRVQEDRGRVDRCERFLVGVETVRDRIGDTEWAEDPEGGQIFPRKVQQESKIPLTPSVVVSVRVYVSVVEQAVAHKKEEGKVLLAGWRFQKGKRRNIWQFSSIDRKTTLALRCCASAESVLRNRSGSVEESQRRSKLYITLPFFPPVSECVPL